MGVFFFNVNGPQPVPLRCVACGKPVIVPQDQLDSARRQRTQVAIYGSSGEFACSPQCLDAAQAVYWLTQRNWLLVEHEMLRIRAQA